MSSHEQMALLSNIGHTLKDFRVSNEATNEIKRKNHNEYQNKVSNNITIGGRRGKRDDQEQISTDSKDRLI